MKAKIIRSCIAISMIVLPAINAHAVTLSMNVGTLQTGVPNNEFLAGTHSVGDGLVQPTIYFSANGGPLSFGPPGAFYAQSANLSYTFEYSFDLNSEAWLTPNPVYCTCSFYGPASAVLMQGQNVVATATSSAESGFQPLVFPAMYLAANTQYKLSISQFGPLDTFTGNGLFSQIALDISPVPEPGPALMFVAGLAALGLRHVSRISLEPRKVVRQIDA